MRLPTRAAFLSTAGGVDKRLGGDAAQWFLWSKEGACPIEALACVSCSSCYLRYVVVIASLLGCALHRDMEWGCCRKARYVQYGSVSPVGAMILPDACLLKRKV